MKKVLGISLLLVVALTAVAFGKPVDQSHDGLLPELPILDGERTQTGGVTNLSARLFTDTVSYGGTWWAADSARWEAIRDSCWTFQTGVGSSKNTGANPNKPVGYHQTMEGWIGIDQTLNPLPYFRRSSTCAISGSFSAWAGVTLSEANALCYAGGQGYGNSWSMYFCKTFAYSGTGNVTFSYQYSVECEAAFDYAYVYVDTTGTGLPANAANDAIQLNSYTGTVSGTANLTLTPGVSMRSTAGNYNIWFAVTSDGSYSDEDGLNPTVCGHSSFDNITVGADFTDFEAGANGWAAVVPNTGVGDFSHIASRSNLPPPAVFCPCAAQDSVLVFFDQSFTHPLDQDNIAASPWINFNRPANAVDAGRPLRLMLYAVYAEMPIANYVFVQLRARYYPAICSATGLIYRTGWRDQNIVFYFGESPFCTVQGATQLRDYSAVIESSAEQVQLGYGMLNLCRTAPFGTPCSGVNNTTPWLDNIALGVGGSKNAPAVTLLTFDRLQDSFAQDGTLNPASTGRFDSNTIKNGSNPIPGTILRDTLVARVGSSTNTEVRFYFRISRRGPHTSPTSPAYTAWLARFQAPVNGFYCARMDTAEQGGTLSAGNYMLTFHESDFGFQGTDRTADPQDPSQLANEILPDRLFTPGTRIDYFIASRYIPPDPRNVGGTNWFLETDTTGGRYREIEILPSSIKTTTDTTWNCVLYVDHHDDRSVNEQVLEELGLATHLGTGSSNFEGTRYDRFDNQTPSSGQLSLGRSIQTNYGCSPTQIFAYKTVAWHSATLSSLQLTDEDANILRPWLTIPEVGNNNFWGSGDGLVRSMATSNEVATVSFQQNVLGVLATCNTVRDALCPAGSALDSTSCIGLNAVAGAHFATTTPSSAAGNGCTALRSFDVNGVNSSVTPAGSVRAQLSYAKAGPNVPNMSVTRHNTVDVTYKTVTDGAAVGALRNTTGTPNNLALCAATTTASVGRAADVLGWFASAASCGIPAGLVDVPGDVVGPKPPQFRHALGNAYPNPMNPTTRIQFTNGVENGRVSLEIFDVTGRLVKSLVNDRMTAGVHEVLWDGTTDSGSSAPSGMYFYKMTGEKGDNGSSFVSSKKLVIMK